MPIYLKLGDVQGDVQESGHANWIELSSVNWGIARPATDAAGSAGGRVLAAPRLSELAVTKDEDVATIPLVQQALEGAPCDATIDFVRTGQDPMEVYYSIVMKEVVVTGFAQASGGDRPVETITLNFAQISLKGTQMDTDGSAASPSSYGWNVRTNAAA